MHGEKTFTIHKGALHKHLKVLKVINLENHQ